MRPTLSTTAHHYPRELLPNHRCLPASRRATAHPTARRLLAVRRVASPPPDAPPSHPTAHHLPAGRHPHPTAHRLPATQRVAVSPPSTAPPHLPAHRCRESRGPRRRSRASHRAHHAPPPPPERRSSRGGGKIQPAVTPDEAREAACGGFPTTSATRPADSAHRRPSSPASTAAVASFRPQPLPPRPAPGLRRRRRDLRDAASTPGVAPPQADIPRTQPLTGAMVARRRHPPSRSAPPERWREEHFLQGSGEHPHPDPICSSAPSPPKAALSRSSTQTRAVQRRSCRPFMNTTPRILVPTIQFNFR